MITVEQQIAYLDALDIGRFAGPVWLEYRAAILSTLRQQGTHDYHGLCRENKQLADERDALLRQQSILEQRNVALREALAMLYDKWENGDPCYQNGDSDCDSLGNAFKLTDEEEKSVLDLIAEVPQK